MKCVRSIILLLFFAVLGLSTACAQTDIQLLDTLQHSAFKFFWQEANPANGLIKDRSASGAASSIASVGFGLTAISIAVDRGWVTREAARDRVVTTLRTFWRGPQGTAPTGMMGYKGFFYHFLDMNTARRAWNSELSSIDSALLLAGILDAKQYFSGADSVETEIRNLADSIYYRVDWNWMRNSVPGIMMGWNPGTQFAGYGEWIGYNEAMIMYILALGSPTHGIPASSWLQWTSGYRWGTYYGQSYVVFAPLFGHQYSHCWIDFRNIRDAYMRVRGIDYFENSRRATLAQHAYCVANPGKWAGYSDSLWGITASDVPPPQYYMARGAPPPENDDGTIAPTAVGGSLPFAPEICLRTLRSMYNTYRAQLWTPYGFRDAFNLTRGWWDPDIIGIDQGPITIMAENYRTGAVWNRFMQNADIQRGLAKAGFQAVTAADDDGGSLPPSFRLEQNYPNPFNPSSVIEYTVPAKGLVELKIFDLLGKDVATLVDEEQGPGQYSVRWVADGFPSGVYICQLRQGGNVRREKMMLVR